MDGYVFCRFARSFCDELRVASGTIVAKRFGNQVVGAFGAFIHDCYESVGAQRTFVESGWGRKRRRRRPFIDLRANFG
jgi:hypothetical protein